MTLEYTVPESKHKYTPDFGVGGVILYETKGKFDRETRKKMLHVYECNPDIELWMVFQNPDQKLQKGAKQTYGEWCTDKGIPWIGLKELTKLIEEKGKDHVDFLRSRTKGMVAGGRDGGRASRAAKARPRLRGPALGVLYARKDQASARKGKRGRGR